MSSRPRRRSVSAQTNNRAGDRRRPDHLAGSARRWHWQNHAAPKRPRAFWRCSSARSARRAEMNRSTAARRRVSSAAGPSCPEPGRLRGASCGRNSRYAARASAVSRLRSGSTGSLLSFGDGTSRSRGLSPLTQRQPGRATGWAIDDENPSVCRGGMVGPSMVGPSPSPVVSHPGASARIMPGWYQFERDAALWRRACHPCHLTGSRSLAATWVILLAHREAPMSPR
jgi:hypothetical protein